MNAKKVINALKIIESECNNSKCKNCTFYLNNECILSEELSKSPYFFELDDLEELINN